MSEVKIFAGSNSLPLAEKIAKNYGKKLGEVTMSRFSDGEMSPSFDESIRGCTVFLIQSTTPPSDNFLELCLMIDAAKRASAYKVCAVIPYYGYARQDRKDRPRVSIAAKLLANMLTSAGADRIMTCDLHAGQIQGFFDIPLDHLNGSAIFVPYLSALNLPNMIFAAPDVGGVARARGYAKHFEVEMVVCDKHRKRAHEIASMQVIGDVEGKDVILVDDLVDTAGFKRANLDSASLTELREEGNVPCVVYGPGIPEQIHFYTPIILFRELIYTPEVHLVELNIEGKIVKAVLKEAQYHPVSENILHVDFMAYTEERPIKFEIPVKVTGSSPGIAKGGKLEFKTRTLKVKGLAKNFPDFVQIDISELDLGKSFKVGDVNVEGFEILTSPNVSIVTIGIPRALRGKKGEA
ncbi:putative ribose-phosphate pyrophosphokise-like [Daphnia sinensis]|uniref:Ribose-phosphate pyrophosphokinase n=1 Tax=Daphnia sinensis TaxID=1820382 RepID=A0AAD5PNS3_9CRUS|nr:putative ribose-phosphate pyrophosphokise-like [Daphnia sinensis]